MSTIPAHLKYTQTHEWVQTNEADVVTVGITDHAQSLLGDMVFVELPEVGAQVEQGDDVCVVESVKAASDVYSPVAGEIIEVNEALTDSPAEVNNDPFGAGWLFKMKVDPAAVESLLDAAGYEASIG